MKYNFKMHSRNTGNVLLLLKIIFAIINNGTASSLANNQNGSSEHSAGFVIHLSNQEILKDEILADIDSKLDQRLEKALQKQRQQFMQDLDEKLEKKLQMVAQKSDMESQFQAINLILDQIIQQNMTHNSDNLLEEMKQLLAKQQQDSKVEHCKSITQLLEKQQHTNYEYLDHMKNSVQKQLETHDNHLVNNNSSLCIPKQKRPRSCAEAMSFYETNTSGFYNLSLPGMKSFEARCLQDPNNGSAWTIIQRRQDNSTDFYRDWNEYKKGFGNLNTNFFIGLDRIHAMTHAQEHELWIELGFFDGEKLSAKYDTFSVGDEAQKYELRVGAYSGNAGDALSFHNGMKFTTKDKDNDLNPKYNCAMRLEGAWWYKTCAHSLLRSNLNGKYLNGSEADGGNEITWYGWGLIRYVHMAIRPKI